MNRPACALVFDYDGLICDTEWPIYRTWADLYDTHGARLTVEQWLQAVGHAGHFDPKRHLEQLTGLHLDWAVLEPEVDRKIRNRVAELAPLPGVAELMRDAKEKGWSVGVASNSSRAWVEEGLIRLGLHKAVDCIRTREDVGLPKPAPDVYHAVLKRLGAASSESIALEDSGPGARSALAAGMKVIAIPNRLTRFHDLSIAHCVVDSLHGLGINDLLAL